jgi:hypothetical protein
VIVFDSQQIVHVAALLQLAGYLFRDQIIMRSLLIGGSCIYVLYYLLAPATPLWGGMFWSLAFSAVNLTMVLLLARDRRIGPMSDEDSRLFALLAGLSPGEFRRLRRMATRVETPGEQQITGEGQQLDQLYFLIEGQARVRKGTTELVVSGPVFVGEVAFLLGRPASATVLVAPGARYLRWDSRALKQLSLRSPSLRIAFTEALNRDMALKVAASSLIR